MPHPVKSTYEIVYGEEVLVAVRGKIKSLPASGRSGKTKKVLASNPARRARCPLMPCLDFTLR